MAVALGLLLLSTRAKASQLHEVLVLDKAD
jgi:hypothetical protein